MVRRRPRLSGDRYQYRTILLSNILRRSSASLLVVQILHLVTTHHPNPQTYSTSNRKGQPYQLMRSSSAQHDTCSIMTPIGPDSSASASTALLVVLTLHANPANLVQVVVLHKEAFGKKNRAMHGAVTQPSRTRMTCAVSSHHTAMSMLRVLNLVPGACGSHSVPIQRLALS
jgi:hypothetical protein